MNLGLFCSKFYTSAGVGEALQDESWYAQHGIEVLLNTRVLSIDLHGKRLRTSIGEFPFYKVRIKLRKLAFNVSCCCLAEAEYID